MVCGAVPTAPPGDALLQLEVARAAEDQGNVITFEPAIPGSKRHGDLLIDAGTDQAWMVETTTIPRAAIDLDWQDEDKFKAAIRLIELRLASPASSVSTTTRRRTRPGRG